MAQEEAPPCWRLRKMCSRFDFSCNWHNMLSQDYFSFLVFQVKKQKIGFEKFRSLPRNIGFASPQKSILIITRTRNRFWLANTLSDARTFFLFFSRNDQKRNSQGTTFTNQLKCAMEKPTKNVSECFCDFASNISCINVREWADGFL